MNRQGRFHRTLSLLGPINKWNLTISYLLDKFDHIFWTGTGNDLEKLNWFCLTGLIRLVQLIWKWVGLILRKNHLWRCWGCLSLLNWIGALTLSLLLKRPPRNLEPWFVLWSFFLLMLVCISVNLPYGLAWNTVVMSALVLPASVWKC